MGSAACSCAAGLLGFARAAARGASRSRFACAFSFARAGWLTFLCGCAEGAGVGAPAAASADATEAAKANAMTNAVQVVDTNEVNDLDRAAAASVPAESSWLTYLLLILGTALAAASAFWFIFRTPSRFARRAAHPRMHLSNS